MVREDKELLLRYLSMALPYGVIINTPNGDGYLNSINQTIFGNEYGINIKPTRRDYFNDEENNFEMASQIPRTWTPCIMYAGDGLPQNLQNRKSGVI